ncbi:helix-turn-helix protein [Gemmata obscuriglobus]|uniref:XRE family transcriptional regulator n=1 Tax=Gemmata obscuriglobus TaxID=114 RepID=A0A2Z3GW89_9BACT|nr:helix-turn-helix transcriptional regulator [Gemmata obscuriglobus]AWM38699.1 XRE family transcriptional regulator [Gemmata obscuriglobus]QEG28335.1 helix-turn-helix protein [Gemmata obscuriglobus]VTS06207.1 dna-binding protein : DNA-binding helix-turn-helix protein OS=Leptospira santarosai str. JET GN=LEP1GSC071_0031 PE=4 SV=1: HTH_31 [Gemmata obscuriglobus UQM 2246]
MAIPAVAKKNIRTGFGKRLRELRIDKNLTQSQLGERAGMMYQDVAKLERGEREPMWATVIRLADALGVRADDFRTLEDPLADLPELPLE